MYCAQFLYRRFGAVAEEVQQGLLCTAHIDRDWMSRRVVCAQHASRPVSAACAAVHGLIQRVLFGMVEEGRWPAHWVDKQRQ